MMPQGAMKPATPAATKYAILFAIVSGIAGVILLVKAGAPDQSQSAEPPVV